MKLAVLMRCCEMEPFVRSCIPAQHYTGSRLRLLVDNCDVPLWRADMMPRFRIARFAATLALGFLLASSPAGQTAKRPLSHGDYDAWRSIYTPTLTRDGRFAVYSYMPQEGDGDLVVRDLKTGQERREGVGAIPPPVIQNADEINPDEVPAPRSVRIVTSSDSRFIAVVTFPSKAAADEARRAKKRPEEMPRGDLLIVDVMSPAATRVPMVKSVQMPARGGGWLAYLKEAPPSSRDAGARESAAPEARAREGGKTEYGTDLVLRDLTSGVERTFPGVLEYAFARDGKTLV